MSTTPAAPGILKRMQNLKKWPKGVSGNPRGPLPKKRMQQALELGMMPSRLMLKDSDADLRPMSHEWARNIRDLCRRRGIAFFFKQSAAFRTEIGTTLDGRQYRECPLPLPID